MPSRNMETTFGTVPVPHSPRSKFKMQTVRRLQTQLHGAVTPFFIAPVYPGDTWNIDTNVFCRADVSAKVPLDDIYLDIYYFFVPYRIIDDNFVKIFGDTGDPYDDQVYEVPNLDVVYGTDNEADLNDHCLLDPLFYLNYNVAKYPTIPDGQNEVHDVISAYPLMAYWSIINYYFRDEQLQASIDLEQFKNNDYFIDELFDYTYGNLMFQANRLADYFSVGFTSPQRGPAQVLNLSAIKAPVFAISSASGSLPSTISSVLGFSGDEIVAGKEYPLVGASSGSFSGFYKEPIYADLSNVNAGSIDQLLLYDAIQNLYRTKSLYGTRYVEVLQGQWDIDASDYLLGNPVYLGGTRGTLSNIPVLDTASNLADMAGNSATLFNDGGFFKSFIEHGVIIGVSCTRIKHTYTQGLDHHLYRTFNELDFYNKAFSNIGFQGKPADGIYNEVYTREQEIPVFNYDQAWDELRNMPSRVAGYFNPNSGMEYSDFRKTWSYADYYNERPTFNGKWIQEDPRNVSRTLTEKLIPNASSLSDGHQFMFAYYTHPVVTRELPTYSIPASLSNKRF